MSVQVAPAAGAIGAASFDPNDRPLDGGDERDRTVGSATDESVVLGALGDQARPAVGWAHVDRELDVESACETHQRLQRGIDVASFEARDPSLQASG
jgi:hypothetical protein